jgi:Domain of unknown function (DUF4184)
MQDRFGTSEKNGAVPFTVAHAAVAPPMVRASRRRLVVSALVVGSMAPDFQSLAHLSSQRTFGHTVPGVFLFCLPVTLAVLVVWHRLVKRPLASLLPARFGPIAAVADRPFAFGPGSRFLAICGAALLGSFSHILWDGFTHSNGFFVEHVHLLHRSIHWHRWRVYDALQYGCSLAALVYLGVWLHRWMQAQAQAPAAPVVAPVAPAPPRIRRTALGAIGAVSLAAGIGNALRALAGGEHRMTIVAHGALGLMAGWMVAVLVAGALLRRRHV